MMARHLRTQPLPVARLDRRQNGRCYQRLHRRARRRPQGTFRRLKPRSRDQGNRGDRSDHRVNFSASRPAFTWKKANLAGIYGPVLTPLPHPSPTQQRVPARRSFFGKSVVGAAPVRYV